MAGPHCENVLVGKRVRYTFCLVTGLALSLCAGTSPSFGQFNRISLDLKNNFSFIKTYQAYGDHDLRTYGQFYILGLSGYVLDPRLLQFSLQTSLTDYSSKSHLLASSQKLRNRNLGYYNGSVTLFPNNRYRLTFYASRSDAITTSSAELLSWQPRVFEMTSEMETVGLRWNIAKNNTLPQIELTLERNENRGGDEAGTFKQINDALSLGLSNASPEGSSQYSFLYRGVKVKDSFFPSVRSIHEFQFYGSSRMSESLDLYSNATYAIREHMTSRSAEFGGTYRQSARLHHQVKLQNMENRFPGVFANRNVTNTISHESHIPFSNRLQGTLGSMYSIQQHEFGTTHSTVERGLGRASVAYNDRYAIADLSGNLSTSLGFERFPSGGRKFTQHTQMNLNGTSTAIPHLQLLLGVDFGFSTTYYFGDILNNNVRLALNTDLIPRSVVGLELSRADSRYFDFPIVAPRSVTSIGGTVTTQITATTSVSIQHSQSLTRSWFRELVSRTGIHIRAAGLIRFLTFQFRAERTYNSLTGITALIAEGTAEYRFYAFVISARYSYHMIAGIGSRTIFLEVHRPFSFDFR